MNPRHTPRPEATLFRPAAIQGKGRPPPPWEVKVHHFKTKCEEGGKPSQGVGNYVPASLCRQVCIGRCVWARMY